MVEKVLRGSNSVHQISRPGLKPLSYRGSFQIRSKRDILGIIFHSFHKNLLDDVH